MTTLRALAASLAILAMTTGAHAQASSPVSTSSAPILITTAGTFQQLLAGGRSSRGLTIQNNNDAASCRILIGAPWVAGDTLTSTRAVNGVTVTGKQGSMVLAAGAAYSRYLPYVPNDQILATCDTAGSSLYVDVN